MSNTELKVGSIIRDNDPRNNSRLQTVTKIENDRVFYQAGRRIASVAVKRVYTDGKARSSGWSLFKS